MVDGVKWPQATYSGGCVNSGLQDNIPESFEAAPYYPLNVFQCAILAPIGGHSTTRQTNH